MLALSALPAAKDVAAHKEKKKNKVLPGVEVLLEDQKDLLKGKKVGLITNPTGIDSKLTSIVDLLHNDPDIELTALFGPEHGVRGDAQAGSYVEFYIDEKTGLPVYSLYGQTKKPTPKMLENVEVLVFDIQDVGTRYYTYIYTMAYAMEAAKENNIPIVVLDRPNPQGGLSVNGPVLEPEAASFVGLYPIPTKHGMTVGELASFFNEEFEIGADLTVVKMKGWKRSMDYDDTGLPFVLPSPNMPTVSTTFVYPATGLVEGTNLSEGRGTTKPFELIGAPFINSTDLAAELNSLSLPGVKFRAASFTPTFSKHTGKLSHGVEIYVTDREEFEAIPTGLHIIKTVHDMYPNDFQFLSTNFFDKLIGNTWVRPMILNGASVTEIMNKYQKEQNEFKKVRKEYLIYK
ncbi:exo-beta-N-acetylmuramidase NamZ family protein [Metabacillus idriensis]|uniref:exo-beta-N-acetylmuramidase NamZ family protein n=1 Tax=Metabacillus idriensis TaxID=324768 RepID=UPI003D2B7556